MSENFKSVLEVRRENMKQQKIRKDHFSSTNLSASMPVSATQGNSKFVLLSQPSSNSTKDVVPDYWLLQSGNVRRLL